MSAIIAIAGREVGAMVRTPVGWVVTALYALLTAVLFTLQTIDPGAPATLRYFFTPAAWLLMIVAPALSMRLFSEEYKAGTIEPLATAPVPPLAIVLGKYLGAVASVALMLAPTLAYPIVLAALADGPLDAGAIASGYLGLLLVAMLYLAVGTLVSTTTESQVLAFLATLIGLVLVMLASGPASRHAPAFLLPLLGELSVQSRAAAFAAGILETRHAVFFVSFTAAALACAYASLATRGAADARPARALKAGVFCLAALAAAAGLSIAATNTNARTDLTLARRHQVSDRTRARLRALEVPVELVVAVARDRLDPRDADRVDDVLAALDAASPSFTVTAIDATGRDGPDRFEDLINRLEARDAGARAQRTADAERARAEAGALQGDLAALDSAATAAALASDGADRALARRLGEFAAFARIATRRLNEATDAGGADPAALARSLSDAGAALAPQLEAMQTELASMAIPARARTRANEAARLAATARARAATLEGLAPPPTDLDRVAEALATGEAALLIGPPRPGGEPGVVALDLDAFYPPPAAAALDTTGEADARVRAEQLVASGLAVLTDDARPIVVVLHGEPQRFVGRAGVLTALLGRLAKSGIDHAEWPVVLDETPPDLSGLDPEGVRPVVYAVISPDSAAPSAPNNPDSRPGTDRAATVARAVGDLIDRGEPVLLGLNPSVFPTFGDTDPFAAVLGPLGVEARTADPILSEANTPLGPSTAWDIRLVPTVPDGARTDANPVAVAINGLPLALEWPLPIRLADAVPDGVSVDALVTLDVAGAWAESEWLAYWRTPRAQRALLRDPPAFSENEDERGPFTVAAAIEREGGPDPTRVVVVGSNTWFLDRVWQGQQTVAGRGVLTNPGNPELFDAAVLWLAGRDDLIAPSPQARPVARVRPLSAGGLSLLQGSLIGGLPLAILLAGAGRRLLRG